MITKKTLCNICGKEISNANIKKHIAAHSKEDPHKFKLTHDGLVCQFCGKECKNKNSLCNHERLCKQNPNRQLTNYEKHGPITGFNNKGRVSNRKGLRKESDTSVQQSIRTRNDNYASGKFTYHRTKHTDETKKILSDLAKQRGLGGTNYRYVCEYNGIKLDSSYELEVAKSLDENDIKWIRPSRLPYIDTNNNQHHYTADFYLPDYDVYLDPKNRFLIENINPYFGYRDIDKIRWVEEQNNVRILILDETQLNWCEIQKLL